MKCISISDLHGRAVWQNVNVNQYDRVIFLGDYTDGYVYNDETVYNNLVQIIQLKRQYLDKVVLLIGNHDAQYMHFPYYRCSGFREQAQPELTSLFTENADLFQIAHQERAYLFTHAGVSSKWLSYFLVKTGQKGPDGGHDYNLARLLNEVHQQSAQLRNLLFTVGPKRGGFDPCGGPIWADRTETQTDFLPAFQQIVGHTPVHDFTTRGNNDGSITYTDVLQTKTAFYEVIIPD